MQFNSINWWTDKGNKNSGNFEDSTGIAFCEKEHFDYSIKDRRASRVLQVVISFGYFIIWGTYYVFYDGQ